MKEIKILLLYTPEQSWPGMIIKPNGSLAELEEIRDAAWEEFNSEKFKKSRKSWAAKIPPVHTSS